MMGQTCCRGGAEQQQVQRSAVVHNDVDRKPTEETRTTTHTQEAIIQNLLPDIAKEHGYDNYKCDIKLVATDGGNFTSRLYHVTLSAPHKSDLKLFAKVAIIGEEFRDQALLNVFDTERFFYTDLVKKYRKIEEKHRLPEEHKFVTPTLYGYQANKFEETIILDNLVAQGYGDHHRADVYSIEYATSALKGLAKFHALSFAYQQEYPEEFKKVADLGSAFTKNETLSGLWKAQFHNATEAVSEDYKRRLFKHYGEEPSTDLFNKFYKPVRRTVLAHADFRPNNMLHKVSDDGSVQVIIIDYQTMQAGSPVMDFIYFIFTGSDEEFRRKHYDQLVELYYSELCIALRRLDIDPEKVYSREDFDYELKELLPHGLCLSIFILPMLTMDSKDAPKLEDNMDLGKMVITTNELYRQRLNGVIDDYVRWGIL